VHTPDDGLARESAAGRKVRTADRRVPGESQGLFRLWQKRTVRAAVTSRVAPGETTKLLGTVPKGIVAILPAATTDLHRNVCDRFLGDTVVGIR